MLVPCLVSLTNGGEDDTIECIRNVQLMRQARECCHKRCGLGALRVVAGAGQEILTRPFRLATGRTRKVTAFVGTRGRKDLPKIVDWCMDGKTTVDDVIK